MIVGVLLAAVLVFLTTLIHYEVLRVLSSVLPRMRIPARSHLLVVVLVAFLAHIAEIALYAAAYYFLRDKLGLGTFSTQFADEFSNYLYFSTETYSSLGFGDIVPTGALRIVTGVEALNGLLLIAWTASFTYMAMEKYWRLEGK
jgi:hypothetical protein